MVRRGAAAARRAGRRKLTGNQPSLGTRPDRMETPGLGKLKTPADDERYVDARMATFTAMPRPG